ncbi:MAG: hypothetical protein ACM3X7_00995 [Solirubrobacterales bacterium]
MNDSDIKISYFDAMHCYNALLTQIKSDTERIEMETNPNLKEFYKKKLNETKEVWYRIKSVLEIPGPTNNVTVTYSKDSE